MNIIIKLGGYYFEWSTIADAPITRGMNLEEFTKYYSNKYPYGVEYFLHRFNRVELKGTSSHLDDSADETIAFNRAGDNETHLTKQEIIDKYCIRKG